MKTKMQQPRISQGIREYCLDSWSQFHQLNEEVFARAPAYVYRGQIDYGWPLRSRLDRLKNRYPHRRNLSCDIPEFFESPPFTDQEHLDAFKRAARGRHTGGAPPLIDDDEWWALGQHHGLATRLLDWTRSPYIALFFAFEEERCVAASGLWSEPEHRGVYALSTSTIEEPGEGDEDRVRLVSPAGDTDYRLISQAAVLLRMPPGKDLEQCVAERFPGEEHRAILTKVKIRNADRHECLVALNKMNINHMTLFPDMDGAARHVNSLWQPGHEDSIAYV